MEVDGFFFEINFRCTRQRLKENSIHGEFNKGVTIGFLLPVSPYLSIELRSASTTLPAILCCLLFARSIFVSPFSLLFSPFFRLFSLFFHSFIRLFTQSMQIYYEDKLNMGNIYIKYYLMQFLSRQRRHEILYTFFLFFFLH
jgi:hypothetical protein